jgi:hypothetical protein
MTSRTEYLENKYLGENAIIKKPIGIPLPYLNDIKDVVWNINSRLSKFNRFEHKTKYLMGIKWYALPVKTIHRYILEDEKIYGYTMNKYTAKELKKIIDDMPIMSSKKKYKSNTTKKELWKIILKYD